MITDYFSNVDDKDLVKMLNSKATLKMPYSTDTDNRGYIHLRPGTMYHELDPMNVVFEVQRRSKWDRMPAVRKTLDASRLKDFKWNQVLDYLILEDENNCMNLIRPNYQKKYNPKCPYDSSPEP